MLIEDEELRNVFKTASEEHLQKLDDGFLYLEKYPNDFSKLEELLREAHSLKGDAGMLGVKDVSSLAHQIEHILGGLKRRETVLTPEISDRLFQGLDALRKLVKEAVSGEPAGIQTFYVLASMMGAAGSPQNSPEAQQSVVHHLKELVAEASNPPAPEPTNVATFPHQEQTPTQLNQNPQFLSPQVPANLTSLAAPYRIESVRVPTHNLDALMTQAGELTVTKIRLAHRLAEIKEITSLWEEWSRESFLNRCVFNDIETQQNNNRRNGKIAQLQKYHQSTEERLERLGILANRLQTEIYEDTARLDIITSELEEGIRTLRLLPLSNIFNLFPRMVRDLSRHEGKEVELVIEGGETKADKRILEEMKDPLTHMIRNAIDHGIETPSDREKLGKSRVATLHLKGYNTATKIVIEVSDDGQGLDINCIKKTALKRGLCTEEELATLTVSQIQNLIFSPGFSTRTFVTEVSGRGVGLDVVRTNVEALKGSIQVESEPGKGSTFRLILSTTLATAHVLIVTCDRILYAFPVEFVQTTRLVSQSEIFMIESRTTIALDGNPLSVAFLSDLLELSATNFSSFVKEENSSINSGNVTIERKKMPCIILKVGEERFGLLVDELIDEQDVVLKPQSQLLKRVRNIGGATILGTGEVCMVLNPQDLLKSVRKLNVSHSTSKVSDQGGIDTASDPVKKKQVILLVEDSIATRTQEKRFLEAAGYEVVIAVDGLDGFNKLKTRSFDGVISDVQMPNLDGLSLTAKIRQNKEYSELPIILVTSLASDEDKKRGAEAGANAYIIKGEFNQEMLLETLKRLV